MNRRTRREGGHYREDPSLLRGTGRFCPDRAHAVRIPRLRARDGRSDRLHPPRPGRGITLAQIRQILDIRDGGHAPCEHVRDLLDVRLAEIEQQIAQLSVLRDTIAGSPGRRAPGS